MGAKRNAVTGLITQLIIIALGLIVPRIMITNYGSDTNGLTNTLTQIFSYIALLEAGIGQSTRNALYKPITENDRDGVCKILSVSRKYYWKITKYYAAIVVAMALLLPFILKTNLSAKTVFAVVFFEGMSGVVRFMFTENWMQLLTAEGKGYVQANITLMGRLLTYGIKIVLACMKINIVAIQFGFFCVSLIQLAVYKIYIDKNYSWIKYDIKACDETELPDKNAAALRVMANAKAMRKCGYDVIFLNSLTKENFVEEHITRYEDFKCFEYFRENIVKYLFGCKKVLSLIQEYQISMVVAYNYPAVALEKIRRYCKKNGIYCIADITEWYVPVGKNFLFRILKTIDTELRMRYVHCRLDGAIVISEFLYQYYRKKVKVVKIPPLVDLNEDKWKKI